jgi:hypothetical protein
MIYTPIPPINFIEKITNKTKSIFMLAQLWQIEKYRQEIGKSNLNLIVLDNGAYEGEIVTDEHLVNVIKQVSNLHSNTKIYPIIPDEIQNPKKTLKRIKQFCEYLNDNNIQFNRNVNLLSVIQVNPTVDKQTALEQMINFVEDVSDLVVCEFTQSLSGFAIPIWFYRKWGFRGDFGRRFREEYHNSVYLHALGLDDVNELPTLKSYFNSVDSSMPFTLAYHNKNVEQIKILNSEMKKQLNITRVPLKTEIPENILHFNNLDYVLKVIN